jgi:hypothetical protein
MNLRYNNYEITLYLSSIIFIVFSSFLLTVKGKQLTARGGLYVCETLRRSHFLGNRLTDGGEVFSFTRRPPYPPPPGTFQVLISVRG